MKKYLIMATPLAFSAVLAMGVVLFTPKTNIEKSNAAQFEVISKQFDQILDDVKKLNVVEKTAANKMDPQIRFWQSMTKAYEWLKSQNIQDRVPFMFYAVEAASYNDIKKRQNAFKIWQIKQENRFASYYFNDEQVKIWGVHLTEIFSNLESMISAPVTHSPMSDNIAIKNLMNSIVKLQINLSQIKDETAPMSNSTAALFILLSGLAGSILLAWNSKSKPTTTMPSVATNEMIEPTQNNALKAFDLLRASKASGVDLEATCRNQIASLDYILNVSNTRIHSSPQTPSFIRLKIQEDSLANAVDHMVKGVLALTNQSSQYYNVEWACNTSDNRATVELSVLGSEFNLNDIKKNHLLLQGSSCISYFAKAEKALGQYRPSVQVVPQNGNTKIALSLELGPTMPSAMQVQ